MIEKLLKMTISLYSPVDEIRLLQVDWFWGIHIHSIVGNLLPVLVEAYDKILAKHNQKYTKWPWYQTLNTIVRERIDPWSLHDFETISVARRQRARRFFWNMLARLESKTHSFLVGGSRGFNRANQKLVF